MSVLNALLIVTALACLIPLLRRGHRSFPAFIFATTLLFAVHWYFGFELPGTSNAQSRNEAITATQQSIRSTCLELSLTENPLPFGQLCLELFEELPPASGKAAMSTPNPELTVGQFVKQALNEQDEALVQNLADATRTLIGAAQALMTAFEATTPNPNELQAYRDARAAIAAAEALVLEP